MVWFLLMCFSGPAQDAYTDQTAFLILKSGARMKLAEPWTVEGKFVLVKNELGRVLQLPVGKVDLPASEAATQKYHDKRKALLFAKPKEERKTTPLPSSVYRDDEGQPEAKKVYDFEAYKDRDALADADYFDLEAAWKTYRKADALLKQSRLRVQQREEGRALLDHFSQQIWAAKALDKERGDADELTWESHKREMKEALDKTRLEVENLIAGL